LVLLEALRWAPSHNPFLVLFLVLATLSSCLCLMNVSSVLKSHDTGTRVHSQCYIRSTYGFMIGLASSSEI
jgi:hypothetical protein